MKTLEQILQNPRPLKEGGRAVDIETTEVFDVVQVGGLHAMCESYGTPHTLALSQLIDHQDAVDCGLVEGWKRMDNTPNMPGTYIVAGKSGPAGFVALEFTWWNGASWIIPLWFATTNTVAWRESPKLPDWINS